MKYSLATPCIDGNPIPAIEVGGSYWDLSGTAAADLVTPERNGIMGLFENWEASHLMLSGIADELAAGKGPQPALSTAEGVLFLSPLRFPNKLMCTGFNYKDHQEETGLVFEKSEKKPGMFLKPPSTTMVGNGACLPYPVQTEKLDWELELALVFSKRGRHIKPENVFDYIAGYAVAADMSARDRQFDKRSMSGRDSIGGKCFDGSNPIGPRFVPAEFAGDPTNMDMTLTVNGNTEISSNTSNMVWSIGELVEEISRHITLEPGDVLLTGCPAGVGMAKGKYLKVGDKVVCNIGELGPLEFEIAPVIPA